MSTTDPAMEPIRVLVCDDYYLIREGVKAVLSPMPEFQVVAEASSAEEALRLVDDLLPDVVIMDVMLPGMDGIEATRQIKVTHPSVSVVVVTRYEDTSHIMQIYRAGASAYLVKSVRAEELARTIHAVSHGRVVLHPNIAEAVIQSFSNQPATPMEPLQTGLSTREMEVLGLVARGHSNKEIARELSISPRTAQNHIANIFHKLELNDRVSAAVYAVKQGYTLPDEVGPGMLPGLH